MRSSLNEREGFEYLIPREKLVDNSQSNYIAFLINDQVLFGRMNDMEFENVAIEKQDGIATLSINRPKALNALNTKTLEELEIALKGLGEDEGVKALIITGAGDRAFVAGADIREMLGFTPMDMRDFCSLGHRVMNLLWSMEKPVIAAIDGYALGGGAELALACDIRIASERARLGLPEVTLGIHPGFGGTQRLTKLVGKGKACELIMTGKTIRAEEALEIGLVNKVVSHEKLMEEARETAVMIAKNGPIAVGLAKSAINKALETPLGDGLAYEIETISLSFSTEDRLEGLRAFLEKREPDFKGR